MDIKTKFKVGDKICVIDYFENWSIKWLYETVTGIQISVKRKKTYITYEIDALIYGGYDEEYCFATKEEAEKECERRNNGSI